MAKKFTAILFAIFVVVGLSACGTFDGGSDDRKLPQHEGQH